MFGDELSFFPFTHSRYTLIEKISRIIFPSGPNDIKFKTISSNGETDSCIRK